MPFYAGFAEVDISPTVFPVRTYLGQQEAIDDPIHAHAAVFRTDTETAAVVSLDVVIVEWEYVERIRQAVAAACAIPGERLLVCATHNHACPAVVERPGHSKEHEYLDAMVRNAATAVRQAQANLAPAGVSVSRTMEARVSFNRRFIKRDGTVISQPGLDEVKANVLCNEGVIDPELGVVAVRAPDGTVRGVLVNFACHACHNMGRISAGYPGVMRRIIREQLGEACAVVFLNGACANLIHRNFLDPTADTGMERIGGILAEDVLRLLGTMPECDREPVLRMHERSLTLGFRDWSALENAVADPRAFVNVYPGLVQRGWYSYSLQCLHALAATTDSLTVPQQALRLGDAVFASVPAEYFTENGLRVKELSPAPFTFVVSLANGWLGYIPTPAAFQRQGGHETFPGHWSKMEEQAGQRLGDHALALIREVYP